MKKKIYIIYSYTGTIYSSLLRKITKDKYIHISLSLDKRMKKIYSFGRKNPKWMFPCGFVMEDMKLVTQVFSDAICQIYELEIPSFSYYKLKLNLKKYINNKETYHYNIKGLLHINFNKIYHRTNHFVCSQFVAKLLIDSDIYKFNKDYSIIKPKDIISIPGLKLVYEGKTIDFIKLIETNKKI